jgi:hypothetical protein
MTRFTKLAFYFCLALTISVASHSASAATIDQRISARLDALERENAALRARVHRLEASQAAKIEYRPALTSRPLPHKADILAADDGRFIAPRKSYSPRFEISGSLLYLQPSAGNLEYGTLVTPLPLVSPSWENQLLKPNYSPAFSIGARYIANESTDIALNWTHLKTTTNASVFATPTQMVGPPFLIGPESALYKEGYGTTQFTFDSVNLDAGYTFCADCSFQLRAFGGVEYARIGQDLTGTFQSPDGSASMASTTHSLFSGVGPRLGIKGQYVMGDLQLIGEVAGAALIGTEQSDIDFTTIAPALTEPNNQSLTSPDTTRVIPSIDARLATAYTFAPGNYGQFKVEVGYRAAIYFDAISEYSLTQVPTNLTLPPTGVYLATAEHLHSSFTNQGPYVTASWLFGPGD